MVVGSPSSRILVMRRLKILLSAFAAFLSVIALLPAALAASAGSIDASPSAAPEASPAKLRVTVLLYSRPWKDYDFIVRSMEYLKKNWPGLELTFRSLPHIPLREELRRGNADLVIASSSFFAMDPTEKVRPLAALVSPRAKDPNRSSAAVVVVRSERSDLERLSDLGGKRIAAQTEECELGLHYVEHEIAKAGFNPDGFWSVRRDEPGQMRKILEDVLAGRIDGGILRGCFLEDLGEKRIAEIGSKLRVLNAQPVDGLACLHSTVLYPGIILAGTSPLGVEHARRVTALLLSMPVDEDGSCWGISTDFTRTDQMLESLKLGPYEYLREWTFRRVWKEYPSAVVCSAILVAALLFYGVILRRLVRIRTRALEEEIEERRRLEREAAQANEQISAMQHAGAVGQISSIIAHELKQPLEAIQNLSRGTMRSLEDVDDVPPRTLDAVAKIRTEALHASDIVDRVREYGKGRRRAEALSLTDAVREAFRQFRVSRRAKGAKLSLDLSPRTDGLRVRMDPLDLRLVIVNLLANAVDAASKSPAPEVRLEVAPASDRKTIEIRVEDNGPRLSDEAYAHLGLTPGKSSKAQGLGLGLMIVKALLEAALGSIRFERIEPAGLRAVASLPAEEVKENEKEKA